MSPEELAEARHYAACYRAGYVHDLMHNFLAHIDQQAAQIAALEAQVVSHFAHTKGEVMTLSESMWTLKLAGDMFAIIEKRADDSARAFAMLEDIDLSNVEMEG